MDGADDAADALDGDALPGSLRENGCCERLNSKLRDELLNDELFFRPRTKGLIRPASGSRPTATSGPGDAF
jgi:hypothetical protein